MKAAPALPLFGDAYLADTRHLSLEEHGAYLQLLLIAWRTEGCALPDDDTRLARMLGVSAAKWRKLKPTVMAFWTLTNGAWTQKRLTKERAFVEEKRAKNKQAADARWNGQDIENKGDGECERISERNAPPPSPPQEEGSVADATGASAPSPLDLKAAIFASGVPLLTSTGSTDRNARSMLGRWRQQHGDGAVLDALAACQAKAASDPIPWITRTLERRHGNRPANDSPSEFNSSIARRGVARAASRRSGPGYECEGASALRS